MSPCLSAPWPPRPLLPAYEIHPVSEACASTSPVAPSNAVSTLEARLVFRDWLDREVSVFARRSHPLHQPNGAAVLHIVGGTQTLSPGDLAVWTALGYAASSFDWQISGVTDRPPERSTRYPAELVLQSAATPSLSAAVLPVAVQAAAVCLDWLAQAPGVDPRRLGVVGISWGGYLAWVLAAHEPRVRALVPAFGCGGLFAPGRAVATHAPEVLALWQREWEPASLGPRIQAPVCFLSGTNDFFGDLLVAENLLDSLPVPHVRHYLPNVDHSLAPAQTRLAQAWLRQHLLDGPPVPGTAGPPSGRSEPEPDQYAALAPCPSTSSLWWTEDVELPAKFRCWLHGPAPADRPILAFTQHSTGELTLSSPISHIAPARRTAPDRPSPSDTLPHAFGLGWRWELGSTRHFYHDASAAPPASPASPWLVCPARPQNDNEPVSVLIHPSRTSLTAHPPGAALRLGWSARPADDTISVELALLDPAAPLFTANARWSAADSALVVDPRDFKGLPADFAWSTVGRLRLSARQARTPFRVGPLHVLPPPSDAAPSASAPP